MTNNYCVYVLIDPKTKESAYVGITNNIRRRTRQHIGVTCGGSRFVIEGSIWRNRIADMGNVDYEILESGLAKKQARERERYWIDKKWREGHALINASGTPSGADTRKRIVKTKWYREWERATR